MNWRLPALPGATNVPVNPGDTISRYLITRHLGKGGMGVVYQAEDTRLQRPVALKFLPPESFDDQDRERFLNEARAAARIRHPNVCPIYDVEEADGQIFISMAYLEGETLSRKVARGPLGIQTAIAIALQIANGLEQAHELGIVHRDIKSANILIDAKGHVSILDFGLALMPGIARLTVAGRSSGTPAFMAPEQALAHDVDARADIWSLGVVLYEMVAGVLPFASHQPLAVMHAIIYDAPPRLSSLRPDVSPALENAIHKALEKSPDARWQRARDLAAELQRVQDTLSGKDTFSVSATQTIAAQTILTQTIPTHVKRRKFGMAAAAVLACMLVAGIAWYWSQHRLAPSVDSVSASGPKQLAVLPFQVTNARNNTGVVADGLMEVITDALSDFQRFHGNVMPIPATEIRRRAINTVADARRIYGVELALTGSAQPQGSGVHFTLQLVDAAQSRQLGTSTFDYDPAAPMESKNRAVAAVANLLQLKPAPDSHEQAAAPDAYSAYLEGRGLFSRYDVKGNLEKAIASLQRATAADPKFAVAWAALGEAYLRQAKFNGDKQSAVLALESAQRAAQLDPTLAAVHVTLGTIHGTAGHNEEAIRELQTALKIAPASAEAPRELARIYSTLGRFPEAEASYLQAIKARPTDWLGHLLLGIFYNGRERYREAEAAFQHASELAPGNGIAARNLAVLYMMQGRYPDSIRVLLASLKVEQNGKTYGTLAANYFYQHRFQEAATAMETALDFDSGNYTYWGNLGIYYKWIPGAGAKMAPALRRAIELAEKKLAVTPSDYSIRADLAEYRARLGDPQASLAEISQIPEASRQGLAGRLAIAYELTGNRSKAIALIGPTLTNSASLRQIQDDPDLATLWADPKFQQAIRQSLRR